MVKYNDSMYICSIKIPASCMMCDSHASTIQWPFWHQHFRENGPPSVAKLWVIFPYISSNVADFRDPKLVMLSFFIWDAKPLLTMTTKIKWNISRQLGNFLTINPTHLPSTIASYIPSYWCVHFWGSKCPSPHQVPPLSHKTPDLFVRVEPEPNPAIQAIKSLLNVSPRRIYHQLRPSKIVWAKPPHKSGDDQRNETCGWTLGSPYGWKRSPNGGNKVIVPITKSFPKE